MWVARKVARKYQGGGLCPFTGFGSGWPRNRTERQLRMRLWGAIKMSRGTTAKNAYQRLALDRAKAQWDMLVRLGKAREEGCVSWTYRNWRDALVMRAAAWAWKQVKPRPKHILPEYDRLRDARYKVSAEPAEVFPHTGWEKRFLLFSQLVKGAEGPRYKRVKLEDGSTALINQRARQAREAEAWLWTHGMHPMQEAVKEARERAGRQSYLDKPLTPAEIREVLKAGDFEESWVVYGPDGMPASFAGVPVYEEAGA